MCCSTLEDVRVPVSHLIGEENAGFLPIMVNFNHERFAFAAMSNRWARVCIEVQLSHVCVHICAI